MLASVPDKKKYSFVKDYDKMLKVTKKSTRVLQKHRAAGFSLRGFA
jgi:hypothetical protein